jgi:hypothetical protein
MQMDDESAAAVATRLRPAPGQVDGLGETPPIDRKRFEKLFLSLA